MEVLIISGMEKSGKSEIICKIANWLVEEKNAKYTNMTGYGKYAVYKPNTNVDMRTIFELNGKKIFIHSATDNELRIRELREVLSSHNDIDILITSARSFDGPERTTLVKEIGWIQKEYAIFDKNGKQLIEIPMIHISYGNVRNKIKGWYNYNCFELAKKILTQEPFNL